MRNETKVILGLVTVSTWVAYRVRKGLNILPFKLGSLLGDLIGESVKGYSEATTELANRPGDYGTGVEQAGAVVARILGGEKPPEIITKPDRVADDSKGPMLGAPRNVLRVAGKVRFPTNGTTLPTKLAADTFDVDAAIENQSAEPRTGDLEFVVREKNILGNWSEQSVSGGKLTLEPREFKQVIVRAPNVVGRPFSPLASNVRLRFAGFTLDSVDFRRTYSLL